MSKTPPDFAALWQAWQYSKAHADIMQTDHARIAEGNAARALLDALTGDATLRHILSAYRMSRQQRDSAKQYSAEREGLISLSGEYADDVIDRLTLMGLLHGPEEGGDGQR